MSAPYQSMDEETGCQKCCRQVKKCVLGTFCAVVVAVCLVQAARGPRRVHRMHMSLGGALMKLCVDDGVRILCRGPSRARFVSEDTPH